jgi:hypothetical protein
LFKDYAKACSSDVVVTFSVDFYTLGLRAKNNVFIKFVGLDAGIQALPDIIGDEKEEL